MKISSELITRRSWASEIRFTHVGLVREYECFDVCSNSWGFYLYTSLRALIRTGHGLPNRKEQAISARSGQSRFSPWRKHL